MIISFGVYLRLKGFLINPSFWHDECALGWNIKFKNYLELFGHLRFLQVAPPLFLIASKSLIDLFHVKNNMFACDMALRLIPFICGISSIGVFYLILKEMFNKKLSIIFGMLLFAINGDLISYSYEFKQYETDMFCVLLLILFFIRLNLTQISLKKLVALSLEISAAIWFSFVTVFVLAASFINSILKRKNLKKVSFLILPVLISFLLYLKFYILNSYHDNSVGMIDFWSDKFVLPNLSNLLYLLIANLKYFFYPANTVLFMLILSIWGIVVFYKERKYDFINIVLMTLFFLILASIFHIYPFSERLILFLAPIFIILMVKPIDYISSYFKFKSFFIIVMLLLITIPQLLYTYNNLKIKHLNKGEFPREMMAYLIHNIKPGDSVFINKASIMDYSYYSSFYNIKNNIIYERVGNNPDEKYWKFLNNLPKGHYWFFLAYDYYPQRTIINYIEKWTKQNTIILHKTEATQSALIYLFKN